MIKKTTPLFLTIVLINFLFPQILYSQDKNNNTLLWEISGKGLSQPSYLYGTIHIQDKRAFQFDDVVMQKFDSCKAYAMEILMDNVDPTYMRQAIIMKDESLDKLLTKEDYQLVDKVCKQKLGMSLDMFKKMKPFFLSSQLMMDDIQKDMPEALDMYFLAQAKKQEKKTFGVEKFEDQVNAVDKISLKDQCKMLLDQVKDTTGSKEEFTKLLDAYLAGDLDKMKALSSDTSMPKNFVKIFITDRNLRMAKSIQGIIKNQETFVAIGAAHLGGDEGVIALLRKKGYTVKPVPTYFKQ